MKNINNTVKVYIALKHMGNISKKVKKHPFILGNTPRTFRELIEESVKYCIEAYKERTNRKGNPAPLTNEQIEGMREIGKLAFGVHYNEKFIDETKAIETAITAIQDGLVRVFQGSDELTDLDKKIELTEGDVFTFVRLTMLSGRMW